MEGKLLIFSAPSGAGKSTIVHHLMKLELGLEFSISATSRKPRKGELDGREYYFISPGEFRKKIRENAFVEWEEVYPDQFYGTLYSEVERIWNGGCHAIFDIDVVGGLNLKNKYGKRACAIFIQAPSMEILEQRLRSRATDDESSLQKRLGKALFEMEQAARFDYILVNDALETALAEAERIVKEFLAQ
ncbi:MAG: guanylate kinase [Bacteroidales bacterium]|nr:guanylate kinase [Bacteroidales bacterium]